MQILKQAIKDKIHAAALDLFYEKDFKRTTMREIATRAKIPVGLIYSYYRNKEELFENIVMPVERFVADGLAVTGQIMDKNEKHNQEQALMMKLFRWRKELVLILDKSVGSRYEGTKNTMISNLEAHISKDLDEYYSDDKMYAKLLATCTIESILMLARQDKDLKWLEKMIKFISDILILKTA